MSVLKYWFVNANSDSTYDKGVDGRTDGHGYDDFMEKYRTKKNPEAWYSLGSVGAFFEGVGVLVHRELIDPQLVGELMSRHVAFSGKRPVLCPTR